MDDLTRPVWAEVNLSHIGHNVRQLMGLLQPPCKLMAVVKGNAYGHGDLEVARTALAHGVTWLGVALPEEGVRLRRSGIAAPILVLGAVCDAQLEMSVAKDLALTVFQWDRAEQLSAIARRMQKTARIHVNVDTGMGRLGIAPEKTGEFIRWVKGLPGLEVQGIYTHFASADCADSAYLEWQWQRFSWLLLELKKEGLSIPFKHCANTAAAMHLPETHLDLVRIGLGLYGLYPDATRKVDLKPALALKTKVAAARQVPAGTAISYHSTYVTWRKTTIITLPIGYADGLLRRIGGQGVVLVQGRAFPIVGRITMDHCMVDVGDTPVAEGEEVVLIGTQGDAAITVDDWASWLDTINYEVPCLISERVPRVYV